MDSDESLLHQFYEGDNDALVTLARRCDPLLGQVAKVMLVARTGSAMHALDEWDVDERLSSVWTIVMYSREVNMSTWPYQRLTALTWLIHVLCQDLDRHLGFRPPY